MALNLTNTYWTNTGARQQTANLAHELLPEMGPSSFSIIERFRALAFLYAQWHNNRLHNIAVYSELFDSLCQTAEDTATSAQFRHIIQRLGLVTADGGYNVKQERNTLDEDGEQVVSDAFETIVDAFLIKYEIDITALHHQEFSTPKTIKPHSAVMINAAANGSTAAISAAKTAASIESALNAMINRFEIVDEESGAVVTRIDELLAEINRNLADLVSDVNMLNCFSAEMRVAHVLRATFSSH